MWDSAYGGLRRESWGEGTEHAWYVHACKPGQGCWYGCGPIHRDDEPREGCVCERCGVEYSRINDSLSVCEG